MLIPPGMLPFMFDMTLILLMSFIEGHDMESWYIVIEHRKNTEDKYTLYVIWMKGRHTQIHRKLRSDHTRQVDWLYFGIR